MLQGKINDDTASVVIAQLLFLESEQAETPISLYINSGGGNVTSGLAIYDTVSSFSNYSVKYIFYSIWLTMYLFLFQSRCNSYSRQYILYV